MVMDSIENNPNEESNCRNPTSEVAKEQSAEECMSGGKGAKLPEAGEILKSENGENKTPAADYAGEQTETEEQKKEKISELFTEGYRQYLADEFEEASEKLGKAVELSDVLYGQFSAKSFQPYLQYGRCLTEIARNEMMLLNKMGNEGEKHAKTESLPAESQAKAIKEGEPGRSSDIATLKKDEEPKESMENVAPGSKIEDEDEDEEEMDDEDEDESGSAQTLAYECLEVARKICEKQEETNEWLEKRASVLVALGECLSLDDCFDLALTDFRSALEIQKRIYEPHDRRIAETHFHIGRMLTQKTTPESFEQAAVAYAEASAVLSCKLAYLEKKTTQNKVPTQQAEDPMNELAKDLQEIVGLKSLIPEVEESIKDAKESAISIRATLDEQRAAMKNALTTILSAAAPPEGESSSGGGSSSSTAHDITSQLIRKKRPAPAASADQAKEQRSAAGIESNPMLNADVLGNEKGPSNGEGQEKKEEAVQEKKPRLADNGDEMEQ